MLKRARSSQKCNDIARKTPLPKSWGHTRQHDFSPTTMQRVNDLEDSHGSPDFEIGVKCLNVIELIQNTSSITHMLDLIPVRLLHRSSSRTNGHSCVENHP